MDSDKVLLENSTQAGFVLDSTCGFLHWRKPYTSAR
jgi:hypothetical protein